MRGFMMLAQTTFGLSLTVPVIQTVDVLPDGRVHIYDNSGEPVSSTFYYNGTTYALTHCDLIPHPIVDTICTLTLVVP